MLSARQGPRGSIAHTRADPMTNANSGDGFPDTTAAGDHTSKQILEATYRVATGHLTLNIYLKLNLAQLKLKGVNPSPLPPELSLVLVAMRSQWPCAQPPFPSSCICGEERRNPCRVAQGCAGCPWSPLTYPRSQFQPVKIQDCLEANYSSRGTVKVSLCGLSLPRGKQESLGGLHPIAVQPYLEDATLSEAGPMLAEVYFPN